MSQGQVCARRRVEGNDFCPDPTAISALLERNLGLQPRLEAMRAETQQYYDRAMAAEAHWPAAEAKMREAYRVRFRRLTRRKSESFFGVL